MCLFFITLIIFLYCDDTLLYLCVFMFILFRILCTISVLSSYSTHQLNVLRHDCATFSMYHTQVAILKNTYEVCLACLLEGHYCSSLKPHPSHELLPHFLNKAHKRQFVDQQLGTPLEFSNLVQCKGPWPVSTLGFLFFPFLVCNFFCRIDLFLF